MKHIGWILLLALTSTQATAQSSILSVSPIPDDAEARFCYYAGLAYSQSSYILLSGSTTRVQASGGTAGLSGDTGGVLHSGGQVVSSGEEKLLECVMSDDVMKWKPQATLQLSR